MASKESSNSGGNDDEEGGAPKVALKTGSSRNVVMDRPEATSEDAGRSRLQSVYVRPDKEEGAMAWDQRIRTQMKRVLIPNATSTIATSNNSNKENDEEQGRPHKTRQYRLEATRGKPQQSLLMRILTCGGRIGDSRRKSALSVGINPNQHIAMYLHWMFRVNFLFLFSVMCVWFFALVIFYAGLITIAGVVDPQCVRVGGEPFASAGTAFADAFALSWTTFSTVGYGSTYPALGYQNENPTNCFFINFICSLESLFGVLYSGFCGAILFGKVLRIQSHAQVIFSDPIVIRYGCGIANPNHDQNDEDAEPEPVPCPVLEFRIVNRLYNELGGEIMDASLNVVANVDASDFDPDNTAKDKHDASSKDKSNDAGNDSSSLHDSFRHGARHTKQKQRKSDTSSIFGSKNQQTVNEDPSTRLVNKHIFTKMVIEASDHPFFKRVWLARHVLDENSPILNYRVRQMIRRNNGAWPERLNNFDAVRESLKFNQILVSLNGVSNISASDVYAQKIYDFVDVNVGYQFVNILYRDVDGTLGVDVDLINDVREQNGGGGEPLLIDD